MKRSLILFSAIVLSAAAGFSAAAKAEKGAHPQRIAQGQEVDIKEHVVPGKITVFDFTSEYCPPCRMIAPHLDELHAKRDDLAVVAVDINRPNVRGIDWKSPVARQYQLQSVPAFKVFDAKGKMIAENDKARDMVMGWIQGGK